MRPATPKRFDTYSHIDTVRRRQKSIPALLFGWVGKFLLLILVLLGLLLNYIFKHFVRSHPAVAVVIVAVVSCLSLLIWGAHSDVIARPIQNSNVTNINAGPNPDPYSRMYGASQSGSWSNVIVVLDPGHGGADSGTCYPISDICTDADITESTVTIDVALYRLTPLLTSKGATVWLTHTTIDENPTLLQRVQLSNFVNSIAPKDKQVVFLSVHLNGFTDSGSDYSTVLYQDSNTLNYAQKVDAAISDTVGNSCQDNDGGPQTFPGAVFDGNEVPAVIVEPVFLTSSCEAILLIAAHDSTVSANSGYNQAGANPVLMQLNSDRESQIAAGIYNGLASYFGIQQG